MIYLFIYLFFKESQAFGHVPRAQEQIKEPGKLKTHTKDTTRIKFHTKETVFITWKKKAAVKHIILNLGLNTLNNASRKHCAIVSVLCLKELGQTATRQAAEFPMAFKGDFSIGPCPDYKETLYSSSVTQDALSVPPVLNQCEPEAASYQTHSPKTQ